MRGFLLCIYLPVAYLQVTSSEHVRYEMVDGVGSPFPSISFDRIGPSQARGILRRVPTTMYLPSRL